MENLYSPSKWVVRMPTDVVVAKHAQIANQYSENVLNEMPHELDIPYGNLEKEKIDVFGTDLPGESPILIFVHGGYWQEDTLVRSVYHFIAKHFYQNKIKTIFVGYELAPKVTVPYIVSSIENATKKCLQYAKEQGSKGLYIVGYSVGGQLVSMLFTKFIDTLSEDDRRIIKSVVMLGGIYDLEKLPQTSVNEPLKLSEDTALAMSPLKQAISTKTKTSFHVVAAEHDSPVFKHQAVEFYEKLNKLGCNAKHFLVENVDHFNLTENLIDADYSLTKYLINIIKEN